MHIIVHSVGTFSDCFSTLHQSLLHASGSIPSPCQLRSLVRSSPPAVPYRFAPNVEYVCFLGDSLFNSVIFDVMAFSARFFCKKCLDSLTFQNRSWISRTCSAVLTLFVVNSTSNEHPSVRAQPSKSKICDRYVYKKWFADIN